MAVLTDVSIENILERNKANWDRNPNLQNTKLLIDPFDDPSLTPVGYDLRVGPRYVKMVKKSRIHALEDNETLTICHREIVAIETEEYVGMPQNKTLSGLLVSKVSIAEKGLSHISTSLDADYRGRMIITLTNQSKRKVILKRKQPFCTVVFLENKDPASRCCGKDPNQHIVFIMNDWQIQDNVLRKTRLYNAAKILGAALPLLGIAYLYLTVGISEVQVSLLGLVSTVDFIVLDKLLKSEE